MNKVDNGKAEQSLHMNAEQQLNNTETLVLNSQTLFKGQRQLVILHAGEQYVLSVTKQGKLILTK